MTVKEQEYPCPYRSDIQDTKKTAEKTHAKVNDMFNRLFVKDNGDPIAVMIDKNTQYRIKTEYEKSELVKIEKRQKWNRRSFYLAIVIMVISNIWILLKVLGE